MNEFFNCRHDRLSQPSYPNGEIHCYPVDTGAGGHRYHGRRHTHDETSNSVTLDVSSSQSRSSIGSSSLSPEPEKQFAVETDDDIFKEHDEHDRRPSFEEMQSEDHMRRPSVTVYQLEDSDHPDIKSIQDLVQGMTFGDGDKL